MKKIFSFVLPAMIVVFTACSGGGGGVRKVIVMSSGKFTVDKATNKVSIEPGTTHMEEELMIDPAKGSFEVESTGNGVKTYDVKEDGVYILNLKNDTLVGGIVKYSEAGRATSISGEQLEKMIDSTRQLIEGRNVSDEMKTYNIIPGTIKKISTASDVTVIGPYKNIPASISVDASGKPKEVYKFFTNKQKRETLDDLMKRGLGN